MGAEPLVGIEQGVRGWRVIFFGQMRSAGSEADALLIAEKVLKAELEGVRRQMRAYGKEADHA